MHTDMVATLADVATDLSSVQKWADEFRIGRESLENNPRSGRPYLALAGYHLLPNVKKHLTSVDDQQDEGFFSNGIQELQRRWKKCVDHRGDYLKNKPNLMTFLEIILV